MNQEVQVTLAFSVDARLSKTEIIYQLKHQKIPFEFVNVVSVKEEAELYAADKDLRYVIFDEHEPQNPPHITNFFLENSQMVPGMIVCDIQECQYMSHRIPHPHKEPVWESMIKVTLR